jgi:hypothetical protein
VKDWLPSINKTLDSNPGATKKKKKERKIKEGRKGKRRGRKEGRKEV